MSCNCGAMLSQTSADTAGCLASEAAWNVSHKANPAGQKLPLRLSGYGHIARTMVGSDEEGWCVRCLSGVKLREIDFEETGLYSANQNKAAVIKTNLDGVIGQETNLTEANLNGATLLRLELDQVGDGLVKRLAGQLRYHHENEISLHLRPGPCSQRPGCRVAAGTALTERIVQSERPGYFAFNL